MKKWIVFYMIALSLITLASCIGYSDDTPIGNSAPEKSSISAAIESENEQYMTNLDLEDYEALADKFLNPIVPSGIASINWADANEIPAEYFDTFYAVGALPTKRNIEEETKINELDYETFVQQYFYVEAEHLRQSATYDTNGRYYTIGYLGDSVPFAVTEAYFNVDLLTLHYNYYSRADETTIIRTGIMEIKILGEGYKYISCSSTGVN